MALQLDVQSPWEEAVEMFELAPGGLETAVGESLGDDPLGAAADAVEAVGVGFHLTPGSARLSLWAVPRGLGEETT
jgi:hypothetical protein